jgi:hypothetical protein
LRTPYRFGIVFDPSGLRKDLFELTLCERNDAAVAIEE